jgi:hypothetical protein
MKRFVVDLLHRKTDRLTDMFDLLGLKSSSFPRLHATDYTPFPFENLQILKSIRDSFHGIDYHREITIDSSIWGEDTADGLALDGVEIGSKALVGIGLVAHQHPPEEESWFGIVVPCK